MQKRDGWQFNEYTKRTANLGQVVYILPYHRTAAEGPTREAEPAVDRAQKRDNLRRGLLAILQQTGDGMRLPPERELAQRLGVARETLRHALQELQGSGQLDRRQGAGTFVAGHAWLKPLQLHSFSEDMRERGLVPSSQILSTKLLRADAKVALKLKIVPGSAALEVRRLRLASGQPMALETAYLARDRLPGFDPSVLATQSLYELLARQHGIHVRNAAQEITATVLTEAEAQLLDVAPFSPALVVERQVFASDGEVVEYGKSIYRADRYRFEVNVGRGAAAEEGAPR
jgi:GntR family transcriptional regulator